MGFWVFFCVPDELRTALSLDQGLTILLVLVRIFLT